MSKSGPLWEERMREVDALLADRELVQIVYEALARRWPNSRTRGRPATSAQGGPAGCTAPKTAATVPAMPNTGRKKSLLALIREWLSKGY